LERDDERRHGSQSTVKERSRDRASLTPFSTPVTTRVKSLTPFARPVETRVKAFTPFARPVETRVKALTRFTTPVETQSAAGELRGDLKGGSAFVVPS
jgi:hypothetical protein